ncbi:hypothetical protein [Amycolatopsis sp. Poz14]|uniref:hypothetical protein n=1 Tax=Amycolatopsis sp. Poz14 TaxID=1447705 RepID=UPI001EE8FD22|nr:hypothetical protein [Amycolatopsis sp. Poz14]MCG3754107.1 hypothetical protein [Amycolatopsis sp. Poz14]
MSIDRISPDRPPAPATTVPAGLRRNRHDRLALAPDGRVDARYADLRDLRLALALTQEDSREETDLDPFDRITCRTHRRWLHQCVSSPHHAVPLSGHRWCRPCGRPLDAAVDELSGDVRFSCPRCGQTPDNRATRQLTRACRASIAAAFDRSSGRDLCA